ncbi:copper homeostasis protein CutC [Georgenia sp. EYE_87]|uniref:copper homeostasis protein CutC n=1 Tax=Georgenia sp. EYE_87 TaxID=2853448 RepID=UPI0020066190|nr:copper homeostasis protein CutC [Georgenia sp. EYE_87]
MRLEITVQDVDGVRAAQAGGADRAELCQALALGGLTPSSGTAQLAALVGPEVHVLIRPREGGFAYTATEVSVMVRDVEALLDAGAAGVVVGALTADGDALDRHAMKALVRAAEGHPVTVHRCVDVLLGVYRRDPAALVDELAGLGVSRMLTSGGAPRALEGLPVLAALAEAAEGTIEITAGGGVRPEHVPALAGGGVGAIHLSARALATDAGPAGPGGGPDGYATTDPHLVAAARSAVDALGQPQARPAGSADETRGSGAGRRPS